MCLEYLESGLIVPSTSTQGVQCVPRTALWTGMMRLWCLIFAYTALCTTRPTCLASSERYPSAALPFILADGLFINAPPSSLSPSLLFLSSIISQLSLFFPLASSHLLFPLPPLPSPLLPAPSAPPLVLSFSTFFPSVRCITFHIYTAFSRFSYLESLTQRGIPCFLHLLTFIYPGGFVLLFHPRPTSHSNIYKSHLGKAPAQPHLCTVGCWAALMEGCYITLYFPTGLLNWKSATFWENKMFDILMI